MRLTSSARVEGVTGVPSTIASPASGSTRPRMTRSTVDFPDPLEPRRTWGVAGRTSIDTPSLEARQGQAHQDLQTLIARLEIRGMHGPRIIEPVGEEAQVFRLARR